MPIQKQATLVLNSTFDAGHFARYDAYTAINVYSIRNIPRGYPGLIGVPISYLDHHDPSKFTLVDVLSRYAAVNTQYNRKHHQLTEIDGHTRLTIIKYYENNN